MDTYHLYEHRYVRRVLTEYDPCPPAQPRANRLIQSQLVKRGEKQKKWFGVLRVDGVMFDTRTPTPSRYWYDGSRRRLSDCLAQFLAYFYLFVLSSVCLTLESYRVPSPSFRRLRRTNCSGDSLRGNKNRAQIMNSQGGGPALFPGSLLIGSERMLPWF